MTGEKSMRNDIERILISEEELQDALDYLKEQTI